MPVQIASFFANANDCYQKVKYPGAVVRQTDSYECFRAPKRETLSALINLPNVAPEIRDNAGNGRDEGRKLRVATRTCAVAHSLIVGCTRILVEGSELATGRTGGRI